MTITVKKNKADLIVPPSIRRRAGIKPGDKLEFKVSGGIITILPKLSTASDEYTAEQRRIIDTRLAEAEKGPFFGPFNTADEAIRFLHKEIKARKASKPMRPRS